VEQRILIHAPRGRDAAVVESVLQAARMSVLVCETEGALLDRLREGAVAAIVTEEGLSEATENLIADWLAAQPPWSDFPFIVLAAKQPGRRSAQASQAIRKLGNVILLERPLNAETLASAADAAARARRRQYAARAHLDELSRTRAMVESLNTELEARIAMRTQELASANDRLMAEIAERERAQAALVQAQKMEAIGRLTGGIAHDFNNLLHVVSMNLDLLLRVAGNERMESIARRAKQAVGRATKLTGQLLSFARNQSLLPRLTDINALVEGMKDLVAVSVGSAIVVEVHLCPQRACAVLDANQLEMAVLNLAVNARDAMASGGRLVLGVERRDAHGTVLPPGDYVVVSVVDNGIGIPPALMSKVFDPFFTTKGIGKGTGLGLSQVYGFARQSGGQALLRSEVGHGTSVEIYFPYSDMPSVQPEEPMEGPSIAQVPGSVRILVVEDDAEVRRVLVESLSMIGYTVEEAAAGGEGLETIARQRPDLLVTDYAMPGMTGVELIAQARELAGSDLPVILATGYADMAEVASVLGAHSILIKPFDISTLAQAVTTALQGRETAAA
jgi:signal transduction histidine kinase/ActR/RegA family two-component response regulator